MYLINRETVTLCVHLLQTKHDELIKSGVTLDIPKGEKKSGSVDLLVGLKHAIDDLIRYDASLVMLQTAVQDLNSD